MKVDLIATPVRQPRNKLVLVKTWIKTAWADGLSTIPGSLSSNAKVDLLDSPGGGPRADGVLWCLVDLCRVGGGSNRLCSLALSFS